MNNIHDGLHLVNLINKNIFDIEKSKPNSSLFKLLGSIFFSAIKYVYIYIVAAGLI